MIWYDLIVGSEVEEKRQLIRLVLSNLMLGGSLKYISFKKMAKPGEARMGEDWQPLVDRFREGSVDITISLHHIQTVFSELGLKTKFT